MVSVGTQTPSSWLRSFAEDEKSKNSVDDKTLLSGSGLPEISAPFNEAREDQSESLERLSLPQIVGEEEAGNDPEPQLVSHLAALQFPSDSDNSSSSSSSGEEETSLPPLVPSAQPREPQLSWPAVLRYLRESESEASKYFSLDRQPGQVCIEEVETDNNTGREITSIGGDVKSPVSSEQDSMAQEVSQQCCHFCGQPLEQWSVLKSATATKDEEAEGEACCRQFMEYCLLVAGCLRQMISERESAAPTAISVRLRNRKDVKTEAEQRALALLQRRRRQRRKLAKKTLQSSSFYSLTKQTKTIQFSLVSPAVLSTGWTLGERQRAENKKKKRKKATKTLPPDIQELLIKSVPFPREVEMRRYSDSSRFFCSLLPDHTGQYRYLSGSLAVLIYSHTPGVLSYLLFNERGEEGVLGYADELGRVWCNHQPPDTNLRLWMTSCGEGGMYTVAGGEFRRWGRENETLFQPLVLPLNKHLTLQLPRKSEIIINFTPTQQHHVKFTINNKLREKSQLLAKERTPVDSTEDYYQCYLGQTQARLRYMLPVMGSRRRGPRGRSRSTGALNFSSTFSSRIL